MSYPKPPKGITSRGSGRGRRNNRGRHHTHNLRRGVSQVIAAKRAPTIQITGDGTDDIIVAAPADESLRNVAEIFLRKGESTTIVDFANQGQIRLFVHSCLLNLSNHHDFDTSSLLARLSSKVGCEVLSKIINTPMGIRHMEDKDTLSFQYVILPLVGVLTRERVSQSMMSTEIDRIYSTVYLHHEVFLERVLLCIRQLLEKGFFRDASISALKVIRLEPFTCQVNSFRFALLAIVRLTYQLLKRIDKARTELASVVDNITIHHESIAAMDADSPQELFAGELLAIEVARLQRMVSDAQYSSLGYTHFEALPTEYSQDFDPPGDISPSGPRNDNDKSEISEISLIPTMNELTCSRKPFLPSNGIQDAPHFLPPGWKRHLDIHFRLYREDLINPLRSGLQAFTRALKAVGCDNHDVLFNPWELKKYHDSNTSLNFYGSVRFLSMDFERPSKSSIMIGFPQPLQIRGSRYRRRAEFWEKAKSRLMEKSLAFLACASKGKVQAHLVVITKRNINDLAKDGDTAFIQISLADPRLYADMIDPTLRNVGKWLLFETFGGFFEAYRPVLAALQSCVPGSLPFGKYIAPTKEEEEEWQNGLKAIDPPLCTQAPGFKYDLSVLLKNRACFLDTRDQESITRAIEALRVGSSLDDTQAKALVETLCREVALISGPPGTGKTKIGVDLMKVLLSNKKSMGGGPILCICYTNHALDQFLEHLLDEKVTDIVRLGARSNSERLENCVLAFKEKNVRKSSSVKDTMIQCKEEWKLLSSEIKNLERDIKDDRISWPHVGAVCNPNQYRQFEQDTLELDPLIICDEDPNDGELDVEQGDFTEVRSNKRMAKDNYDRWVRGLDIEELERWNNWIHSFKDREEIQQDHNIFSVLSGDVEEVQEDKHLYHIPDQDRPLGLLDGDIWEMSMTERKRLAESWRTRIRSSMADKMEELINLAEQVSQRKNEAFDDVRREVLQKASVIGMTTSGAAKYQALLKSVSPSIIVCEEAGEVLESHILSALSDSTQHLILIGDHLQLRPSVETYMLSSESKNGDRYKLDMSLFERLVTRTKNPFPMSSLTIQRRMRPEISSLIRNTLYKNLEDGGKVLNYPSVCGMGQNLFFMDHAHPEDKKEKFGIQSFSNTFEIRMVEALARHLIKNGYNKQGDIAVLTPYLGQLTKLRDALRNNFILTIDERDQLELSKKSETMEQDVSDENIASAIAIKEVGLQDHLTLRTIDNYQGEEAKIVIITLVRSNVKEDGVPELSDSGSIGFLKSENRTNVLLSRAKHGMYLIGNAPLMEKEKHRLWPKVIEELRQYNRVGEGLPIVCKNHPHIMNFASTPEMLRTMSPDGGCSEPCNFDMSCGHTCPKFCHPDDPGHNLIKCDKPCLRRHRDCGHACLKLCRESCGLCTVTVAAITLNCGHAILQPKCWQATSSSRILCTVKVSVILERCGHKASLKCHEDPEKYTCSEPCRQILFCGHICGGTCNTCREVSEETPVNPSYPLTDHHPSERHRKCLEQCGRIHPCGHECLAQCHHGSECPPCTKNCTQILNCGHDCLSKCHKGTSCPPCQQSCKRSCIHTTCKKRCIESCIPCNKPCVWGCVHQGRCKLPCRVPCGRLPCNERCEKVLQCGHRCPSVCGEKCPSVKYCVECTNSTTVDSITDSLYGVSLGNKDINMDPIMVLQCGHTLHMSHLDNLMQISSYYTAQVDMESRKSTFVSCNRLPIKEDTPAACPRCRQPITGLLRYGRRLKNVELLKEIDAFQGSQANHMKQAIQTFETGLKSMAKECASFLKSLSNTTVNANSCMTPPKSQMRPLGRFGSHEAQFRAKSFTMISQFYDIPKKQEQEWRKFVAPIVHLPQQFTAIHQRACRSSVKQTYDAAVEQICKKPASLGRKSESNVQRVSEKSVGVVDALGTAHLYVEGCGLPHNGLVGSSYVDSLLEQTSVVMLIASYAFSSLQTVGAASGWYWFVEDLFRCAFTHIETLARAAYRADDKEILAYSTVMRMDVICRLTQWMALRKKFGGHFCGDKLAEKLEGFQKEFEKLKKELEGNCAESARTKCTIRVARLEEKITRVVESMEIDILEDFDVDTHRFERL